VDLLQRSAQIAPNSVVSFLARLTCSAPAYWLWFQSAFLPTQLRLQRNLTDVLRRSANRHRAGFLVKLRVSRETNPFLLCGRVDGAALNLFHIKSFGSTAVGRISLSIFSAPSL
jgi:hypothetical protein